MRSSYSLKIKGRTVFKYIIGIFPRYYRFLINGYISSVARRNGASIGSYVAMPYQLAKIANQNLIIGNHVSIQSFKIDLRSPVYIGNYVIIGSEVEIITTSHNVDSTEWEVKHYGLHIDDYAWIATRALILPTCRKISKGAVCAAGSVVASSVSDMEIVVGNPAKFLRNRGNIHSELCVESLLGNDYIAYKRAYNEYF